MLTSSAAAMTPQVAGPAPCVSGRAAITSSAAEIAADCLATLNHILTGEGTVERTRCVPTEAQATIRMTIGGGRKYSTRTKGTSVRMMPYVLRRMTMLKTLTYARQIPASPTSPAGHALYQS